MESTSDTPNPTTAASTLEAGATITVVGVANRRRLALLLCIDLALICVSLTQLIAESLEVDAIVTLVVGCLGAWLLVAMLRRPPRMGVANGSFTLQFLRGPRTWPVQEIVALDHDGDAMRLTFRSVADLQPPRLRKGMEKQFARNGCHLAMIGPFTAAQIDQVRGALGLGAMSDSRPGSMTDFRRALREATPRVWITPTLIAVNLIAFCAMALLSQSHFQPSVAELTRWGANFGPLTTNGQTWRLITSIFAHAGLLHLSVNMLVLAIIGPLIERLLGNFGFANAYMFSGAIGSIASIYWHPAIVSVGASGAIFGLFGVLGAFLLRYRQDVPAAVVRRFRGVTVGFVISNLIFGLLDKRVDNAAHLGGLLGGFVIGLLLVRPLEGAAHSGRIKRTLLAATVSALSIALAISSLHGTIDDLDLAYRSFAKVQETALARIQDAEERHAAGVLSDADFIAALEKEANGPWLAALDRLAGLQHLPSGQHGYWSQLVRYATLRREGWLLLAKGIQQNDEQSVHDAREKQSAADAIANEMSGGDRER